MGPRAGRRSRRGGRPDGHPPCRVNAATAAAEVADRAYTLAGGSSVYQTNVLQRCLRDAHVPTQHLQVAPKLHETLGRLLLGQEADVRML